MSLNREILKIVIFCAFCSDILLFLSAKSLLYVVFEGFRVFRQCRFCTLISASMGIVGTCSFQSHNATRSSDIGQMSFVGVSKTLQSQTLNMGNCLILRRILTGYRNQIVYTILCIGDILFTNFCAYSRLQSPIVKPLKAGKILLRANFQGTVEKR